MLRGRRGGQTWSFDLMIAVVLFIVVIGIFYAYLSESGTEDDEVKKLSGEARIISNKLDCNVEDSDVCIAKNGEIEASRIDSLKSKEYETLKKKFDVDGDFCIYLRTPEGDLVDFNGSYGIGDSEYKLAENINCSQLKP
ncbi:MAG: hypothetical protein ACQESE_04090 [Nanobdellota archaeon]